jgi:hypothetical protein
MLCTYIKNILQHNPLKAYPIDYIGLFHVMCLRGSCYINENAHRMCCAAAA